MTTSKYNTRKGVSAEFERALSCIARLSNKEGVSNSDSFASYLRSRGAFTPRQMVMLFGLFRRHKIYYQAADFKIIIKKHREQEQLKFMSDTEIKIIWGVLSKDQKQWAKTHRNYLKK